MSGEETRPIIVIKKPKKRGGGHHGGAWKIAYADFVTAMMAFFLLMWLLGSTSSGDLQGIEDYFKTPLKVALSGGSGAGDNTSVLVGGGRDLTKKSAQVNSVSGKTRSKKDDEAAVERAARKEMEMLRSVKARLEKLIDENPLLAKFKKQMLLDITSEGLRIQVVDEQNRPMFENAKADLLPHTKEILHEIGKVLNDVPNRISLSGHTDIKPYASGERGYSNWELSADRANASRRELLLGGMAENKVLRVVGLSSSVLFDKENGMNPINRRISIVVMNRKTEEAITKDGDAVQVAPANLEEVGEQLKSSGAALGAH